MVTPRDYSDPAVVAMALSLYAYNVDPLTRAQLLYDHFDGECAELGDLVDVLAKRGTYAATELAFPTAEVYVQHALERYGDQAAARAMIERDSDWYRTRAAGKLAALRARSENRD